QDVLFPAPLTAPASGFAVPTSKVEFRPNHVGPPPSVSPAATPLRLTSPGDTLLFDQPLTLTPLATAVTPSSGTPTDTGTFKDGTPIRGDIPIDQSGRATLPT